MRQWTRGQFTGKRNGVGQSPDPCKGEPAMQGKSFPCDFMVQQKIERSGNSSLRNGQDEMTLPIAVVYGQRIYKAIGETTCRGIDAIAT